MSKLSAVIVSVVLSVIFSQSAFAATRTITVTGQGSDRGYCNANAGYFCIDNIKRRSQSNGSENARWNCEMGQRGRALTYTLSQSTFCNPNSLPPNHDGTWVSCRTDARMQCEVNN